MMTHAALLIGLVRRAPEFLAVAGFLGCVLTLADPAEAARILHLVFHCSVTSIS